jgi:iron(III) transport system permease protein
MSATLTPGVEAPAATPRTKREIKQLDFWTVVSLALLALFGAFLIFPLWQVLKESVVNGEGDFTLQYFVEFFSKSYYFSTIYNSFVLSIAVTLVSLAIGIPFSYFYTYFKLRGQKLLFIGAVLSCMSAPFIGAYAWILLMGRNGLVTQVMGAVFPWAELGSIYGFGGLVFVLSLKLFPLVSVYMNGAFRSIDNSLLEAASLMGSSGLKRILTVTLRLTARGIRTVEHNGGIDAWVMGARKSRLSEEALLVRKTMEKKMASKAA